MGFCEYDLGSLRVRGVSGCEGFERYSERVRRRFDFDFYAAYESIPCPQQRCLIHLIRDINEDVLKNPFNEELAVIAKRFGSVLRGIVDTVDLYGLKAICTQRMFGIVVIPRHAVEIKERKQRVTVFLYALSKRLCHL